MIKSRKINDVAEEINFGKTSIGMAAEECEVSIWEMLEILKTKNVNWTGYDKEDLKKELEILK